MASIVSAGTTSATALNMSADTSGVLQLASNNGTVAITVDTSQNVGVGVTPGSGSNKFIQVGGVAQNFNSTSATHGGSLLVGSYSNLLEDGSSALYLNRNAIYNTGWKYLGNTYASQYIQINGQHQWLNAPSGTAGNAITFTQAMTLDASGNWLLGTTGALGKATITGGSTITSLTDWNSKANTVFQVANTALRIGIGYDANDIPLIQGFTSVNASRDIAMQTYGGNLLVGTPAIPTTQGFAVLAYSGGTYTRIAHNTSAGASDAYIQFHYNSSQIGQIQQNGTTAVQYTTTSDYRLKENVQPMTGALGKIALLKPVTYKWKSDGSDGQGFIAHELQEVVPDCVGGAKDAMDEDGNPIYQGIDTSFLVATLTAAIQEQQALITQLQADVAALKGA